jgi:hypothetical protein
MELTEQVGDKQRRVDEDVNKLAHAKSLLGRNSPHYRFVFGIYPRIKGSNLFGKAGSHDQLAIDLMTDYAEFLVQNVSGFKIHLFQSSQMSFKNTH